MGDPVILFVKPAAISVGDKAALQAAGVIVVEVENPQDVKLVRARAEVSGGDMLRAAAQAIHKGDHYETQKAFARAVCAAIAATHP